MFYFTISDDACITNKKKRKNKGGKTKKKEQRDILFEALYWKYSAYVFSYAFSRCQNQNMAEEVFQETWLNVFKFMDMLEKKQEEEIEDFILKTADNRIKRLLSEERKLKKHMVYDLSEEIVDDSDLFAQCESQGVEVVLQCFEMLSEEQSEVLRLYYLGKMPLKKIAKHLNLSESAVNSRWCRGRKKLIELLKARGLG